MNFTRQRAGYFAKKIGSKTEDDIEAKCRHQGILLISIPSGCEWVGANRVIPVPTPFDCVGIWGKNDIFFDIKTTANSSFSYSAIHAKPHQIDWLVRIAKRDRRAGFLVHFREAQQLVWFDAVKMAQVQKRESLGPQDGLNLGEFYQADLTRIFLME